MERYLITLEDGEKHLLQNSSDFQYMLLVSSSMSIANITRLDTPKAELFPFNNEEEGLLTLSQLPQNVITELESYGNRPGVYIEIFSNRGKLSECSYFLKLNKITEKGTQLIQDSTGNCYEVKEKDYILYDIF